MGRSVIRPEHDTETVFLPFHGGAAATTVHIYKVDDSTPEFERLAPRIWNVGKVGLLSGVCQVFQDLPLVRTLSILVREES